MSRQWTFQGSVRGLIVVLVAMPAPALAVPVAVTAAGPSVPLPKIDSVPAQKQGWKSRTEDEASRKAMTKDQNPRNLNPGTGSPSATSLSLSATWTVSGHTGDFTWSYPLRVPPAPGGLVPILALSYRSSAVDGRTSATNNQPSWIGDGWDLWPGYIERSYCSCMDDDVPQKRDCAGAATTPPPPTVVAAGC